ncbi:sugar phosphate isomerase/epimerase family protein [Marivirga arenosa]|uniref:Sugar phosphate isomerase/epimerase n=1 Tax=Marivirga arenosa TaxID=3059076 RepID=A0AA49GG85_9BACT|nr:sugar phosphate isomerase/epimerase [Marivirga sp. BKB1-2]WKK80079.2 sugar phosphate isomerase/epimerase [Marivirga sp. BKB1-2]
MERRKFIRNAGIASVLAFVSPSILASCSSNVQGVAGEAGLQIYTLRKSLEEDFKGTIERAAKIGYKNLELFNYSNGKYFGNSIKEVKSIFNNLGVKAKSSHVLTGWSMPDNVGTMTNDWERTVADAAELGQSYIVCAYLFDSERKSIDDYKNLSDLLNSCGETAKEYGLQMAYHNHDFEFMKLDGEIPYDLLLSECDLNLVKFELDLYWTARAGVDPIQYFKDNEGRFPLWHVKDMAAGEDQFFSAVGEGVIDWKNIFNHASTAGLKQFFVEQDDTKSGKPFEEITKSYEYLKGIKKS